jgi:hypothetical protein
MEKDLFGEIDFGSNMTGQAVTPQLPSSGVYIPPDDQLTFNSIQEDLFLSLFFVLVSQALLQQWH